MNDPIVLILCTRTFPQICLFYFEFLSITLLFFNKVLNLLTEHFNKDLAQCRSPELCTKSRIYPINAITTNALIPISILVFVSIRLNSTIFYYFLQHKNALIT